jgi:hypothetical protein
MYDYFYYLALVPQIAAMIHYFRHRPETYWFYIILFFGPLGALAYFVAVFAGGGAGTTIGLNVRGAFDARKKAGQLQTKIDAGEALPYNYFELGELQFQLGRYEPAVTTLTEALRRTADNTEARYYLALSLEKVGRYADAARELAPLVQKDPKFKFGEALNALARCYKAAGQEQLALATYERVLAQSSFAEARYHLAELLIKQGQKETGRQHLEKLIRDAASPDLPSYQRRQERRWARRAKALLAGLS